MQKQKKYCVHTAIILAITLTMMTLFSLCAAATGQLIVSSPEPISSDGASATASGESSQSASPSESAEAEVSATPRPTYDASKPEDLQNLFLYAETGVLIEQHSGEILYDMKSEQRMQPASTTKVMTLLVALENADLDDEITVGPEINEIPADSTKVPLIEGETVTLRDLLYGLILRSGGDAAMSIAVHVGGDLDTFVDMMNAKAKELGCTGTHFSNPHGYESADNYTTALDLAKIARAGMEKPEFREIVKSSNHRIEINNKRTESLLLRSTNRFVLHEADAEYNYPYGTGIKTGYFKNAGHTFVSSATKDGVDLIAVVMKSTQKGKWSDAIRLMDYGFAVTEPYSMETLYSQNQISLPIDGGDETLNLILDPKSQDLNLAARTKDVAAIQSGFAQMISYEGPATVSAPVAKGDAIGNLQFKTQNGETLTYQLLAEREIVEDASLTIDNNTSKKSDSNPYFVIAIVSSVIAVILLVLLILQRRKFRKYRWR